MGIPSRKHVAAADYVGILSGRNRDKFQDTDLTPQGGEKVNAPLAAELPFSLECRLFQHHKLRLHTIFIGDIIGIQADEDVLGLSGFPDIKKTQAILWGGLGNNHNFAIGEKLAQAFTVGKSLK